MSSIPELSQPMNSTSMGLSRAPRGSPPRRCCPAQASGLRLGCPARAPVQVMLGYISRGFGHALGHRFGKPGVEDFLKASFHLFAKFRELFLLDLLLNRGEQLLFLLFHMVLDQLLERGH